MLGLDMRANHYVLIKAALSILWETSLMLCKLSSEGSIYSVFRRHYGKMIGLLRHKR